MPVRLVALDEGADIVLDRAMVVVGRHPQCDARLDSLRISRHHCCMTQDQNDVVVRDLGSTNGIRINGQRVEVGRLRPGDELSIAHIRYRLDNGQPVQEKTLADPRLEEPVSPPILMVPASPPMPREDRRRRVPARTPTRTQSMRTRWLPPSAICCRRAWQTVAGSRSIVHLPQDANPAEKLDACRPDSSP